MLAESQPPRGLLGSFPYRCVPTHQGKTTGPMGDRKVGLRSRLQSLRGPKILRARDAEEVVPRGECKTGSVFFQNTHRTAEGAADLPASRAPLQGAEASDR